MRALLFAAVCAVAGPACTPRAMPYRFSMPMLGQADVPLAALPAPARKPNAAPRAPTAVATAAVAASGSRAHPPRPHYAYGWQTDAQAGIRVASAKGIELTVPAASDESAIAVRDGVAWSNLPAPNRPAATGLTARVQLPGLDHIREAAELRGWVGRRDAREPLAIVLAWLTDLGRGDDEMRALGSGAELVTWAAPRSALLAATEPAQPGDLLVFDRAMTNSESDLVALVIGRDERGVTEMIYAGGGVIRRGFVDVAHPSVRRDLSGRVVNTFLRHGGQWPAKGTRYLAGELLAHVIRVH